MAKAPHLPSLVHAGQCLKAGAGVEKHGPAGASPGPGGTGCLGWGGAAGFGLFPDPHGPGGRSTPAQAPGWAVRGAGGRGPGMAALPWPSVPLGIR